MTGAILQAVRKDAKKHVTEGGFQEDINITTPDNITTLDTVGWAPKHHLSFDTDGTVMNAKNARITIDEDKLVEAGYPVRKNGEVKLINHKVVVKDSSGIDKTYVIKEQFPDETIGIIICILGDLE